jgi:hypothetical protein
VGEKKGSSEANVLASLQALLAQRVEIDVSVPFCTNRMPKNPASSALILQPGR